MIDKKAFLAWVNLPASKVSFSSNGDKDTCFVRLRIDGQSFDYHVRLDADGKFVLEETSYQANNNSRDAAEFHEDQCEPILPADSLEDRLAEEFQDLALPRSAIQRFAEWHRRQIDKPALPNAIHDFISRFLRPGNLRLRAWGLAFALELDSTEGRSMADVGKEIGLTRQAVSKEANFWSDWWDEYFELPRSRNQKSSKARRSYRTTQKLFHWRHKCKT